MRIISVTGTAVGEVAVPQDAPFADGGAIKSAVIVLLDM